MRQGWPDDRHLVFRTTDVDDARERAQRLLVRHRLDVDTSGGRFEATVHRAHVGALELMRFRYGAPSRIHSAPLERFVVIHIPRRGRVRLEHRGQRAVATPRRAAVYSACGDIRMEWSDGLDLLAVKVPRDLLERRVAELVGHPLTDPLEFDIGLGPTRGGVAAAVGMALRALATAGALGVGAASSRWVAPGGDELPAVRGAPGSEPPGVGEPLGTAVTDALVAALVLEHPHNHLAAAYAPGAAPSSRVVRTVADAVRADPAGAHTSPALAALAGVSERALQLAFRRDTGVSPMAYLRRVRLEAARDRLAAARPEDGATVLDVAVGCGFGHTGRFAAEYRRRFGEPPSATLRR